MDGFEAKDSELGGVGWPSHGTIEG